MTRAAWALGFSAVWSNSPPPSPTFLVSPGGCAIFVKTPLVAQEIRAPSLERWVQDARLCIVRVIDAMNNSVYFASCYGYAVSHANRGANEAYLRDVLTYLGGLSSPAVMMGDLNDHPTTSDALAQAHVTGMYRISGEEPTTLNKEGEVAKKPPIDHCLANRQALDMAVKVKVDSTLQVSDHLPILLCAYVKKCYLLEGSVDKASKESPAKNVCCTMVCHASYVSAVAGSCMQLDPRILWHCH